MYENTVIDLNSDTLPFSCIVDGNEAVTDFQIVISRLKDSVIIFDTGMQKLATPFFPINNRNQNVVFSIDLKDYPNIASSGNDFVNSADPYYWEIVLKNSSSGTETHSAAEVFYANSTPKTTIYYSYDNDFTDLPENVDFSKLQQRKVYFKSTYSQTEGIPLKRYGWRLTDITNNVVVMDTITQNQIYGISDDISCVCNGLINQTNYQLELYIETQNGHFGILQTIKFNVDYSVKSVDAYFEVEALNNTSGILLSWDKLVTTEGTVNGSAVSYTDCFPLYHSSSVKIPENTSITFSKTSNDKELNIDEESYIVLSFGLDKAQNTTLFEISGVDDYLNTITRKLEYTASDRMLRYVITSGNITTTCEKQLSEITGDSCWYVVTLYPLLNGIADYKLVESIPEGGLFPDEDLFPTEDNDIEEPLYPDFGEWNKLRGGVN